jgi:hypothetical protein
MGISRRKPNTNVGRQKALTTAKERKDSLANPADNVLTPATEARLDIIEPLYKSKMTAVGQKLSQQKNTTGDVEGKKVEARMYVSHFIQSFNNGVDRGLFPAGDRSYYMLPNERVPSLDKESDIVLWGGRIKDGDALRVADGGAAMSMPSAVEVDGKVTLFKSANNVQANKKLAFDQSQEAVVAQNPEAEAVIGKIWDEAETFYNEESTASRRRKCREWGVVYVSDIPNIIHVHVKNSADNTAIAGATILVLETENSFVTDASGNVDVKTNVVDLATLRITADDFIQQDVEVELEEGVHEYTVEIAMVHV